MPIPRALTRLALPALLLLLPCAGSAVPLPTGAYVDRTDAIVVGRLTIVELQSTENEEKGKGFVTVEEVVAGPVAVGDSFPFEWHARFDTAIACPPSYRREAIQGVLGIWFLERTPYGALRLMGEFWNLENPQSLEYHAGELKALEPRTERGALLLEVIEKQALRVKDLR